MLPKRFCVKCGIEESEDNPIIDGLCLNCLLKERRIVEIHSIIKVNYCKVCGAVQLHGKWTEPLDFDSAVIRVIESYLEKPRGLYSYVEKPYVSNIEFLTKSSWSTHVRVEISAFIASRKVSQKYDVVIRLNPTICPRCIMRRSGDYTVLVQLRAPKNLLRDFRQFIKVAEKHIPEEVALNIVDIIDKGNNVDILFYEKGAANKFVSILKHFGNFKEKRSFEEVGIDRHGKKRRRTVISLHFIKE